MSLELHSRLSSSVVQANGGPRLVYLLLEVQGGQVETTLAGNLSFVIDVSESMRIGMVTEQEFAELARQGLVKEVLTDGVPAFEIAALPPERIARLPRRIGYVAQALAAASAYLRPVDIFSVVAFAGRAQRVIPATSGRERVRLQQAARDLEFLSLGDGTQMDDGLAMGLNELLRPDGSAAAALEANSSYAARLILLTDGYTRSVSECYRWAEYARQSGVKLTTMGLGVEFNEDLLIPLADRTGGSAYYLETPDKIGPAFQQELGSILRTSYQDVEIKLKLSAGVELRRVHRVLPELGDFDPGPNMDGSYALLVGDYDPGLSAALLLELVLPPAPAGAYRIAQAMLAWVHPPPAGTRLPERQVLRQDIVIERSAAAGQPDERVMNVVERVGAFKMGVQALELAQDAAQSADPAQKGQATARLRQAATRLLDMGEAALAQSMLRQADHLEHSGALDPQVSKKLRYETRRLTQDLL